MPFTLSHPIFAAPLRKLVPGLSLTGLVLGSMAPDMEYFLAMQPFRTKGHSLEGFFLMGIPLCTALAYAFHRIILPALPQMLPSVFGLNRFASLFQKEWSLGSLRSFVLFYVSLFIGFLTHIFVDGWSHRSGYFVERLPALRDFSFTGFPGFWLVQQGLSVLGLVLPLLYLYVLWRKWRSQDSLAHAVRRRYPSSVWGRYALIAVLAAAIVLTLKLTRASNPFALNIWFVAPFSSLLFGVYAAALLRTGRVHRRIPLALGGLAAFAVLFVLLQIAKQSPQIQEAISIWYTYIWLFSGLVFVLSLLVGGRPKQALISAHHSPS